MSKFLCFVHIWYTQSSQIFLCWSSVVRVTRFNCLPVFLTYCTRTFCVYVCVFVRGCYDGWPWWKGQVSIRLHLLPTWQWSLVLTALSAAVTVGEWVCMQRWNKNTGTEIETKSDHGVSGWCIFRQTTCRQSCGVFLIVPLKWEILHISDFLNTVQNKYGPYKKWSWVHSA